MIESFVESVETLQGRKMNCECALSRNYLTSNKPSCCLNGNYKSVQCIGGLCFCVDEYGRQVWEETEQSNSHNLPCWTENPSWTKYDFCCDSESYSKDDWCYEA